MQPLPDILVLGRSGIGPTQRLRRDHPAHYSFGLLCENPSSFADQNLMPMPPVSGHTHFSIRTIRQFRLPSLPA